MDGGASRAPPHDLILDRVEHTRGLHSVDSPLDSALGERLGLGPVARSVARGGTGYPPISPGISGDREGAFRGHREEISPDPGEIGVR
jgi:hypothetical protein